MNASIQPLQRHDLAWLSPAAWQQLLAGSHDSQVRACLDHWCDARLPVVVGRQQPGDSELAVGLPTPIAWGRRKVSLRVTRAAVLQRGMFPDASDAARVLAPALRRRWAQLQDALADCGAQVRVHGSHGWQCLTGQGYVVPSSDIDLLVRVGDAPSADAAALCCEACEWPGPRIDGELIFPDGSAVAWREWRQWRAGAVQSILVKRLYGVTLENDLGWLPCRTGVTA